MARHSTQMTSRSLDDLTARKRDCQAGVLDEESTIYATEGNQPASRRDQQMFRGWNKRHPVAVALRLTLSVSSR